ncbi:MULTISPECIES: hypothetical protein [Streptomyces]|uniref:Secreted protein n=1 Tax=Streptomyces stelliscabiei TaxID=146820 RepID=A0A8I0PB48_9ACTN|nr:MULTISPECIES: hypothetical protein [Streptomyces]KND40573.1 hypothetical protein IQ64_33965 [Streptomyces stelliscabiei]MBE1600399.1 hypothetical protein [Streptomyces stelliscabiei]MDX2522208.1 hypothetical protein [Streptomyces stelliscabiei]MDX2557824.1 hypothetical protein [Streptomyces stelliscabiei]MDX2617480.1 hypothetical protein [Streptomyces stelliscabiei]
MRRTAGRAGAGAGSIVDVPGAGPGAVGAVAGAGEEAASVASPFPTTAVPPAAAPAVAPAAQRLRTEFPFELPRGYVDEAGNVHREGVMRLATARDELIPLRDVRVQENPAYLSVVLLGRVITRLGNLPMVHDGIVENMFASDLAFLQDFYRQVNAEGHTRAAVECPHCSEPFEVELGGSRLGES